MYKKYANISLNKVLSLIKNGKANEITLPFNTKINNQPYYVQVDYDLGGYNPFTDQVTKRGYYLDIAKGGIGKGMSEIQAFGGGCVCINEVKRRSKKQARISNKIWYKKFNWLLNALKIAKEKEQVM